MVDFPPEFQFQSQLQGGNERLQLPVGTGNDADRQQNPDSLRNKLPVQIKTINQVFTALLVTGRTGKSMHGFPVIPLLDLAADPAKGKPLPGSFLTGNGNFFAKFTLFPEIDFTKVHLGQKIETKRKVRIHLESRHHLLLIKFHQHLLVVKHRVPVITVIADAAPFVRRRSKHLPKPDHPPFLPLVGPHGAAAFNAAFPFLFLSQQFLVGAPVAETPGLNFRHRHINLIDPDSSAAGIKSIFRCQLRQGAGRRAFILVIPGFVTPFPFLDLAFAPVNEGIEHNPDFGKGIIGQQAFIGKEIVRIPVADAFGQGLQR